MGDIFGGITVFQDARPDDGLLALGVVTAHGAVQMARRRRPDGPRDGRKVAIREGTKARSVTVKLDRRIRYELDGGDRKKVKSFTVDVEAGAVTVRVPDVT